MVKFYFGCFVVLIIAVLVGWYITSTTATYVKFGTAWRQTRPRYWKRVTIFITRLLAIAAILIALIGFALERLKIIPFE